MERRNGGLKGFVPNRSWYASRGGTLIAEKNILLQGGLAGLPTTTYITAVNLVGRSAEGGAMEAPRLSI